MARVIQIPVAPGDQHDFAAGYRKSPCYRGSRGACSDHDAFHSIDSHNRTFVVKFLKITKVQPAESSSNPS
jgi:hypothetical protein